MAAVAKVPKKSMETLHSGREQYSVALNGIDSSGANHGFPDSDINDTIRELGLRIARLEAKSRNEEDDIRSLREDLLAPKKLADARIAFIDSKFDKKKGKRVDQEVEDFFDDTAPCNNPITARRTFNDDNLSVYKIDIIINGGGLRNLLKDVLSTYLQHEFKSLFEKNEVVLPDPFIPLTYNWEQLQAATKDPEIQKDHGHENVDDLKRLLGLVYRLAPEYVDMRDNIKRSKTVMERFLHCIFKPGSLVVATFRDQNAQLMKVHHYGAGSIANTLDTSSVFCEGYDWNGKKLVRLRYEFPMPKMVPNEQYKVRDLPCFPLDMYEDLNGANKSEELKAELIKRGQRFEKLCAMANGEGRKHGYSGQFQVEGDLRSGLWSNHTSRSFSSFLDPPGFNRGKPIRSANFQVPLAETKEIVIDFASFLEYGPREAVNGSCIPLVGTNPCNCPLCISPASKNWIADFGKKQEQEDVDDYALLPHRALGFALDSKQWGQFLIKEIIEPDPAEIDEVFDKELVFPQGKDDENKRVVKELILNHGSKSFRRITDPVGGKGQGLVLLFHGPPGVGKTMTAETLAKSCGKIILSVGIGDLGTTAEVVEQSLHKLFDVIIAWHGILLIDEADIFLDSRGSKGDVFPEQNAMVSVMLRLLEYFSGILIMTTNRVKSIDYAIMSRISYAIKFQALSIDYQRTIYDGFLKQAQKKIGCIPSSELDKLKALSKRFKTKENLNGRDIRTMFTTAQLLGQGKLNAQDMETIYDQQTSFKDDMNNLYILAENQAVVK